MVQYIQDSWRHILKWSIYFGLNNVTFESWEDFIKAQWSDHVQATWTSIDDRNIRFLKQVMAPFFVHGRDHAITHCHVYCPMFAWTIYKKTFGDPLVYERTSLSVPQAKLYVDLTTHKTFLKKYKWGMDLKRSTLPIAYLLFKQKKQYKSARPIISYLQFVYAKLFKAVAIVIDLLAQDVCPGSFGCTNLPAILMKLTHFLQNFPDDAQPAVHNQDLVGFFTSIPVERILSAIQWLINGYAMTAMKRKADISTALFSVDLKEKDTKLRIWKGRQRKSAKRIYTIFLRDVVGICKLSCEVSMFTVMGGTFRQTRGAAIGNQISPTLANATVAVREQQYANSIHHLFGQFSNSFCDWWYWMLHMKIIQMYDVF